MPDFCIIGAAKAGTTALNAMLEKHPRIFMCALKEPHYFSTPEMLARGDDWYRGLYAEARPDQLCGEASTSYARFPLVAGTAERMAAANPDMRLIYILREPVSRTESECLQLYKYLENVLGQDRSRTSLDAFFHEVEDPDHEYYQASVEASIYVKQVEAFEAVFPAENILVLMQSDLRDDPKALVERICAFLGIQQVHETESDIKKNVSADFLAGRRRRQITSQLRRLPFYAVVKSMMTEDMKKRVLKLLSRESPSLGFEFSDELRTKLREGFREPNRRLKDRLGDLPPNWEC